MIEISPQWMLLLGIGLSFLVKNRPSIQDRAKRYSSKLLQISVILLGSALNFHEVLKQGADGALITSISIALVFIVGFIGIKVFRLDKIQGLLITAGTAICGGSAIGALAPVLGASSTAITISIGIVFLLNALSVFIFPPLGHYLALTQEQFGLWSALAIHDTSAVVASSSIYGKEALAVATTIKLTRALWIIPVTLLFALFNNRQTKKITIPWFILGFLICSVAFTFIGPLHSVRPYFLMASKQGFAFTLYLIGLTFNPDQVREAGARPFVFGIILWALVSLGSFYFITLV